MKTNGHEIGRREFLLVSSTCALATAVVGPQLFGAEGLGPAKRLAVGFAQFEETAAVIPASAVPAGDGRFISRGARITVSGASGAPADPRQRRAVELLAHFSYFDGADLRETPFRAWACSRNTGCEGHSVSFNVPVDEQQRVRFSVVVETGAPEMGSSATSRRDVARLTTSSSHELPVTLSLLSDDGAVKLARGYYVIVPLFENDREPRWSDWTLRTAGGRAALTGADGLTAPFEHFVIRIDYAS